MKRLPTYDAQTSRVERGAFIALSLAAAALVVTATLDSARFASKRDNDLMGPPSSNTALVQIKKAAGSTNLTVTQPQTPEERARLDGLTRPKS